MFEYNCIYGSHVYDFLSTTKVPYQIVITQDFDGESYEVILMNPANLTSSACPKMRTVVLAIIKDFIKKKPCSKLHIRINLSNSKAEFKIIKFLKWYESLKSEIRLNSNEFAVIDGKYLYNIIKFEAIC